MLILALRTEKSEAEVRLMDDQAELASHVWEAGRQLSLNLHKTIENVLKEQGKGWKDLSGIVVFKGPGSFTGLRIGLTVGNTLATSLNVPIVGATGDEWLSRGIERLLKGDNETIVVPEYGAEAHITQQKK